MKVALYSAQEFERPFFKTANRDRHEIRFIDEALSASTVPLAEGCEAVCCFVSDRLSVDELKRLQQQGIRHVALRSAGFNNLDTKVAKDLGLSCVYVPVYSPNAIAEYAVGILLSLNRKIHRSHLRVKEHSFVLDGFVGFDLSGKTVGVIGTGRIGKVFSKIMLGFGCDVLAHDTNPDLAWAATLPVRYCDLNDLLTGSDVVSLHLPLNASTHHLISEPALRSMKKDAILLNTSRGGVVDNAAMIEAIENGRLGGAALDVYEFESGIFFRPPSEAGMSDELLARLIGNMNVLLTGHQAFLTQEALKNIAETTLESLNRIEQHLNIDAVRVPNT